MERAHDDFMGRVECSLTTYEEIRTPFVQINKVVGVTLVINQWLITITTPMTWHREPNLCALELISD